MKCAPLIAIIVLFLAGSAITVKANEIPSSCLMSFNVKNKSFDAGNVTMSCVLIERIRTDMFLAINKLDETGAIDGPEIAKRIAGIDRELQQAESQFNWTAWGLSLSGNAMATLGLASCLSPGPNCWVAVIGKLISFASIINSSLDDTQKKKASQKARDELEVLRQKVANAKPKMGPTRSQLVQESIQLCETVRKSCL